MKVWKLSDCPFFKQVGDFFRFQLRHLNRPGVVFPTKQIPGHEPPARHWCEYRRGDKLVAEAPHRVRLGSPLLAQHNGDFLSTRNIQKKVHERSLCPTTTDPPLTKQNKPPTSSLKFQGWKTWYFLIPQTLQASHPLSPSTPVCRPAALPPPALYLCETQNGWRPPYKNEGDISFPSKATPFFRCNFCLVLWVL